MLGAGCGGLRGAGIGVLGPRAGPRHSALPGSTPPGSRARSLASKAEQRVWAQGSIPQAPMHSSSLGTMRTVAIESRLRVRALPCRLHTRQRHALALSCRGSVHLASQPVARRTPSVLQPA